jgi:intergrase/recombinase
MPTVKPFDEEKAKQAVKECPKIVRDYVKLLTQHMNNWKDISQKAISKLKKVAMENQKLKEETKP